MKKLCLFFVLLVSCSSVSSTIRENRQAVVNLETDTGITTGVLVEKYGNSYVILTVAHLCEPTQLIDDDIIWIAELDISIKDGSFCAPSIKFVGNDTKEVGILYAIDFKEDLALFIVQTNMKLPISTISKTKHIYYGQELYSITAVPEIEYPLVAYGKVGGLIKAQTQGRGIRSKRSYIQTQFMMGSGSSGSPVFNISNELIGLHSVELVTHGALNTRFSFSQPVWVIRKFMKEVHEHKLEWDQERYVVKPFCKGTKFQCAVMHGTSSLLEGFLEGE